MAQYSRFASIIYNFLIRTVWISRYRATALLWNRLWAKCCQRVSSAVTTTIHGHKVSLNFGHPYPIIARQFRSFNNPLVELVNQSYLNKQTQLTLIDVGAGIGDTVLLLQANCPEMLGQYYCIDGDPEFFAYLQKNLEHFPKKKLVFSLLSSSDEGERALVRTHKGTASSQGNITMSSSTLDSILMPDKLDGIDVIKIDVDGFDGKVLLGSSGILANYRPAVIFEWHPILCKQTGNNWLDHFSALSDAGYSKFVWFNKLGEFSHFMECLDTSGIDRLAEFCLNNSVHYDWHYDVIALHHESPISPYKLAESYYARNRKSRH